MKTTRKYKDEDGRTWEVTTQEEFCFVPEKQPEPPTVSVSVGDVYNELEKIYDEMEKPPEIQYMNDAAKHFTSEDILNAKLEDRWELSGMSKEAFEVICEAMEDYVLHVLKNRNHEK